MDTIYIKELRRPSDEQFEFHLSNGEILKYLKSVSNGNSYYLTNRTGNNSLLFDKLGFIGSEKNKFVSKIVGYEAKYSWPEVKSEKDLIRVINALCACNNTKYNTIKKDFIIEDYPMLPSEVLSFYNVDKTEVTFEELGLKYQLYDAGTWFWWYNSGGSNDEIFNSLKISNKNEWVDKIIGYASRGILDGSFPEVRSKGDDYKVMNALIAEYIKQFKPKTTIKTNSYGNSKIELRRKKADVRVGSCPAGSIVYGKRGKASIRSRSISYTACPGY